MNKTLSILCGICCLATAGSSLASIVSVTGGISVIGAPVSVAPGQLESSTNAWAFDERQSFELSSDLMVDRLIGTASAGSINSGTVVNSYFIHADPVGSGTDSSDVVNISGTVTFDTAILGLIWTGQECNNCPVSPMYLDASDYLGAVGTIYPTGSLGRGYEVEDFYAINGTQDFVISDDGFSLTTLSSAAQPLFSDQLRVITAASPVPLPLPVWLFLSGLLALVGVGRKR